MELEKLYIVTEDHKKHEIEPLNCDELILEQSWHVETLEFELIGKVRTCFTFLERLAILLCQGFLYLVN